MGWFKKEKPVEVVEVPTMRSQGGAVIINPSNDQKYKRHAGRIAHIKQTLEKMNPDDPRRKGFELEMQRRILEIETANFKLEQEKK